MISCTKDGEVLIFVASSPKGVSAPPELFFYPLFLTSFLGIDNAKATHKSDATRPVATCSLPIWLSVNRLLHLEIVNSCSRSR